MIVYRNKEDLAKLLRTAKRNLVLKQGDNKYKDLNLHRLGKLHDDKEYFTDETKHEIIVYETRWRLTTREVVGEKVVSNLVTTCPATI